ncbi:MAG: hypothetical protein OXG16_05780 [Rhodospirillales bacterium]|nr:hypothetical protein [Rhodospirillales bacterium]
MNEFDHCGQPDMAVALVTRGAGAEQRDEGADALPTGIGHVPGQFRDQGDGTGEVRIDRVVDASKIVRDQRLHRGKT